ncbi:MAG: hypothetical protein A2Y12_08805 [Planctomycetes bacterium GWF2_42_9]|nr:MAG: hypothetical protein A2Y12_08805 [Planctomycetes bacterium GWF2_42_9]HAL45497.1 hypothetical protein [Phycisphaerales bacterium]
MGINSDKYKIENNQIINIKTGVAIPDNEPVFILRAKDTNALSAIGEYYGICDNVEHSAAVGAVFRKFADWQDSNQEIVKEPD